MNVGTSTMSPTTVRAEEQRWYEAQVRALEALLGDRWAEHHEWIDNYLRAEIRARLIAKGWVAKR